jgi:hypothetical protein
MFWSLFGHYGQKNKICETYRAGLMRSRLLGWQSRENMQITFHIVALKQFS